MKLQPDAPCNKLIIKGLLMSNPGSLHTEDNAFWPVTFYIHSFYNAYRNQGGETKKIKADYSSENHHNLLLFEIVINCLTSMWVTSY